MSEATPGSRRSKHSRRQVKTPVKVGAELSAWPGYPAAVRGGGFVFVSGVRGGRPGFAATRYDDLPEELAQRAQGYTMVDALEGTVAADAWTAHDNMARKSTVSLGLISTYAAPSAGTKSPTEMSEFRSLRDKSRQTTSEKKLSGGMSVSEPTLGRALSGLGYRKISARPRHHAQNELAIDDSKEDYRPNWRISAIASHREPR